MTPNTTVTLYATDFDISNRYVIAAASTGEALGILGAYPSQVYTNCYWQRTDDFVFRCNGNINEVEQYNYCVFLNNGRYNFAFITKCQYVNDAMTWVYLTIDPWLNFAGQYVFHDSPMRRCHPPQDNVSFLSYATEPYEVGMYDSQTFAQGTAAQDDDKIFICTNGSGNPSDLPTANDCFKGQYDMLNAGGYTQIVSNYSQMISPGSLNDAGVIQPTTSLYNSVGAWQIVHAFTRRGLQNNIVCMYHVPKILRHENLQSDTYNITYLNHFHANITVSNGTGNLHSLAKWLKIKYGGQFRSITMWLCGNPLEVPAETLDAFKWTLNGNVINFVIEADPIIDGAPYMMCTDSLHPLDSILRGNKWDRVSISQYAPDTFDLYRNDISSKFGLVRGLMSVVGSAISGNVAGMAGGLVDTVETQANRILDRQDIIRTGGAIVGAQAVSNGSYNQIAPLVYIDIKEPSRTDINKLNVLFGTYGYTWNEYTLPITFKNLPYWSYYETIDASITGKQVPQKYLNQVIAMFNRGVFVFNDTSSYKDFSKAADNHY